MTGSPSVVTVTFNTTTVPDADGVDIHVQCTQGTIGFGPAARRGNVTLDGLTQANEVNFTYVNSDEKLAAQCTYTTLKAGTQIASVQFPSPAPSSFLGCEATNACTNYDSAAHSRTTISSPILMGLMLAAVGALITRGH